MELLELVLSLLVSVLISSVLEQVIPRLSLPLVQIAIGVVLAVLLPQMSEVSIDPELFLVLFIAPLLFDETRRVDKIALWKNKLSVVSLAIGLVLACVLACGFCLHWFEPSIPLAACFALGAALGPTDAVAVSSLGRDIRLNTRQRSLLSGEALINDASGVVSFQFAIAAVTTGTFSAFDASVTFAIMFFGGIALGIVLGSLLRVLKHLLRSNGLESTTVHVVLEVIAPFVVYLVSERIGVSGILAVVAAGLIMNTASNVRVSPTSARLNIVSTSVWDVLVFIINGIVFVLLGMQLPGAITPTWMDTTLTTPVIILLIVVVTAAIVLVRFIWLFCMECVIKDEDTQSLSATQTVLLPKVPSAEDLGIDPFEDPQKRDQLIREAEVATSHKAAGTKHGNRTYAQKAKSAFITTLAGPKGAVTLSIAFTIPLYLGDGSDFPYRDLLIFIASGVILLTLLLANFLLPVLAPQTEKDREGETLACVRIKVLQETVKELKGVQKEANDPSYGVVIRKYRDRIRRLRANEVTADSMHVVRREVVACQQDAVHKAIVDNQVSLEAGQEYANRLKRMAKMMSRPIIFKRAASRPWKRQLVAVLPAFMQRAAGKLHLDTPEFQDIEGTRLLVLLTEEAAVEHLQDRVRSDNEDIRHAAGLLLMEHNDILKNVRQKLEEEETDRLFATGDTPVINLGRVAEIEKNVSSKKVQEAFSQGYRIELEKIQDLRELGTLTRKEASELREEVYLMQMDMSDAL